MISEWLDNIKLEIEKKGFEFWFGIEFDRTENIVSMNEIPYFIYLSIVISKNRHSEDIAYICFDLDLSIDPDGICMLIRHDNWFNFGENADIHELMGYEYISYDELRDLIIKSIDYNSEEELMEFINKKIREKNNGKNHLFI